MQNYSEGQEMQQSESDAAAAGPNKSLVWRILIFFSRLPANIAAVLILIVTLLLSAGVFARYFGKLGLTYVHEIALLSAVWVAFLGAAEGIRNHYHVRIDVLTSKLPRLIQVIIELTINICLTIALGALAIMGYRVLFESSSILDGLNMSRKPLIAAMPVSFTFMTCYMAKHLYDAIRALRAHDYSLPVYVPEVVEGDDDDDAFARLYAETETEENES